jgi:lipoate synthase
VAIDDLIGAGCRYRAPSEVHAPALLSVYPDGCDEWAERARPGGLHVTAGPLMRSSYRSGGMFNSEHLAYRSVLQ